MNLSKSSRNLAGVHAILSPSSYHWLRYTEDKLDRVFHERQQAALGSRLHAWAHEAIDLRQRQPKSKQTMNQYINDGIGFKMTTELLLYYSDNCFGHADCLSFNAETRKLRIHDLKTGVTPSSMDQLLIYAALFCLEYKYRPFDIEIELRIYQNDSITALIPEPTHLMEIIDTIVTFSKRIDYLREEAL